MRLSEDVEYITLQRPLPLALHGYVWPFAVAYAALLGGWVWVFGALEFTELFFIVAAIIGSLNIVSCLFCVWSVHVRCVLTCRKVPSVHDATLVKVVPTPNNGSPELVALVKQKHKVTKDPLVWFMFQKTKYLYEEREGVFKPLEFPVGLPCSHYHSWPGLASSAAVDAARQKYGKNRLDMMAPDFWALFRERATAPFFVFQVFCVGLWCLDEYWYYSLFTLFMLVTFEAILVKQQQRNLSEVRKMGAKGFTLHVHRGGKWLKMSSDELLPGDIVSIGRSKDGNIVPCDILLLRGPCIVDEALLTGESVPQMKEPLDPSQEEALDLQRDLKLHVISGGTRVVQHTPPDKNSAGMRAPDNGCIGYVLRTGFNTSQGKLLRTILFGVKRVTANNLESFVFIMFLLVFAIIAASYVWVYGTVNEERNRYKLFLECTLILTSVVPPELPIELSLAVNTSLIALTKLGIYCTEPFRIPFGGKVDVCCFDKTGTLTSDNLIIQGIAGLESAPSSSSSSSSSSPPSSSKHLLTPVKDVSFEVQCVLASCHSLALLEGELVGDPLEKAALAAIDWSLGKSDTVTPRKGRKVTLRIVQRFHFSSALKRMSAVCSLVQASQQGPALLATAKGAPEVLKEMFSSVPPDYDALHTRLTRHGSRVLALGYRQLGTLSMREVHALKRHDVEKELTFAGFIVISCPLKNDSKTNIKCLHDSSHYVIMLTGDNPLTACHVAKELKIARRKVLVLTRDEGTGGWAWQNVRGDITVALETKPSELGEKYDLCLTGDGLSYVLEERRDFAAILPYVKIFARVAPKQKEVVVTTYKSLGYNTLMCGDGTNDVGALKHAHVGVALLSAVALQKHKENSTAPSSNDKQPTNTTSALARKPLRPGAQNKNARVAPPPSSASPGRPLTPKEQREQRMKELVKQFEEATEELRPIRLGDASIASPFTSRDSSITCICHVIKQGRCTLVTTLQMFKILALNALILAYSQSVLYLDGIKFSDFQATLQGLLLAGCFLCISRSRPLTSLSKERPLPNIFNFYTLCTVLCQFVVHFACLVYLVQEAKLQVRPSEGGGGEEGEGLVAVDVIEKEFEQNELNSAVYLISIAMQISNFAVNYKGHPFMASLRENKPLLYSLLISAAVVFVLASGLIPQLSATFEITPFTNEFRNKVLVVLVADVVCSYTVDRLLSLLLGAGRVKLPRT